MTHSSACKHSSRQLKPKQLLTLLSKQGCVSDSMKGWSLRPCLALPHCLSVTSRWPLTCRVEICPSSLPDITHASWQISHVSPTACRPKTHISPLEILRRCDKTSEWISKEQKGSWRRHHKQALEVVAWGCFSVLGGDVSGGDRNSTWSESCHVIPTGWNALDSLGFKVKREMRLTCYSHCWQAHPKTICPKGKYRKHTCIQVRTMLLANQTRFCATNIIAYLVY